MADLAQELRDARAREAATSEILRVINRSPTDYQPVFEAILEHATRLCDASLGFLCLREDEGFRFVADRGTRPETSEHLRSVLLPLDPERSATAKAATERRPFEVLDVADAHSHGAGESARRIIVEHEGIRTLLTVPMLRGDESVGVILIYRREVRSFEPSHIELLTTFAEQAAIAVDNVRRFRALGEALERQTATSDILRTISRSPTDYQPVFDTILENATRLCDAPLALLMMRHDDGYHLVAHEGTRPEYVEFLRANLVPLDPGSSGTGQAGTERRPVQMADVTDSDLYREGQVVRTASADIEGIRSALWVPMIKNDECLGVICLYRREVRPFDQSVVDLVLTFANQAVIAIDNVRLFQALEARTDELGEALERQTATSDILRAISRSPTDYGPVFDVILDSATRLCEAPLAVLILREGEHYHLVAHRGTRPEFVEWFKSNPVPVDAERSFSVRAATEGVPLQIPDFTDTEAYRHGAQHQVAGVELEGIRSALLVPMMKGDDCVGVIAIYRREVQPFDESHIGVVSTFADQAVIAIDNVRLFQALEARTDELGEALERQTATSDILRTISRSPTDYGPVFDAILESSTRLCDAPLAYLLMRKEEHFHYVAHKGGRPEFVEWSIENPVPVDSPLLSSRAAREGVPQQLADITESEVYRDGVPHRVVSADLEGIRSALFVPMMKGGECVGIICLYRREVRPFDEAHVALVSTFGDQAVIAIDNVRLFQALEVRTDELGEALERQTATSDILRTISRSPTDYGPVFEAILDSATRLCDAPLAFLLMREGDHFHIVADKGSRPEFVEWLTSNPISISEGKTLGARAAIEGVPQQLADLTDSEGYRNGMPHRVAAVDIEGVRTALFVPMMKDNECVGAMSVYRREVRLFDESQIALLSTFVDQAVIAIDNVRLFQALEARTDELGEALERQTATSDILRTISQSPTDYGPVFDAILDSATRLCDAPLAFLLMREGDYFHLVAHKGSRPEFVEWTLANPVPFSEGKTLAARAAIEGVPRQLADITDTEAYRDGLPHRVMSADVEGIRTTLFVPMMKGDDCVGVIAIYRREVRSFNESHIALVSTFADQAVIAIDNVHLFQALDDRTRELARSVEELRALGEIGQAVNSTLDPETVLSTIINQAVALTGTDGGLISEYDEATGTLPARAAPGFEEILEGTDPVRIGEGAMGQAAETRTPVQIPDIDATDAYTGRLRAQLDRAGLKALLAVPLLREDRVLGTLLVARKTPGEFPPGTVELLGTFAAQSALAIHNARLFREIEEKGRELAQANQHKSEFLANMSHELRTPLNAVIGFSEVLGEEMFGELNEKQSEYVDDIHTSGRHLLSLINDILDLSKIEAGRMELDVTTFDIREALGNALTLVGERAARGGIVLESEIEESLADMTGDERKVKQILLNLLSNAVKFTPEGGRVTLTAKAADVALVIAVRDTGVGISAEDQEHIFEEFRQVGTDYARKVEGTGLGLTLTRRFVELHGGEIAVESEPGAGSEFLITLPLEPPAAAAE